MDVIRFFEDARHERNMSCAAAAAATDDEGVFWHSIKIPTPFPQNNKRLHLLPLSQFI
jgi:hypothetical protein